MCVSYSCIQTANAKQLNLPFLHPQTHSLFLSVLFTVFLKIIYIYDIYSLPKQQHEDELADEQVQDVEAAAETLYGFIHARYILSRGLSRMLDKFQNAEFGFCPRVYCESQQCLPIGLSDQPGDFTVKLFCPRCDDVFTPRASRHQHIDGAFFGTTFPHMLFAVHPEFRPPMCQSKYEPTIYGFKLHHTAYAEQKARRDLERERERVLHSSRK